MMDFLKANPHVTREDYLWKWTVPQVKLASYDSTRIEYSKSKSKDKKGKKGKGGNKSSETNTNIETTRLDSLEAVQAWVSKNGEKSNM